MDSELLTPEEIAEALQDRRLYVVSEKTGISYGTLKQLRDKEGNPTYETLAIVTEYLMSL